MKKPLFVLLVTLVMIAGCIPTATGQPPVVNSFDASPGSISSGESSTLNWNVSGVTTVSIDQGIGNVALCGTRVVSPSATTSYILTATSDAGSVSATAQIMVDSGFEMESEAEAEEETATVSEHAVRLHSIASEDGNVKEGGPGLDTYDPIVGDDIHNKARQAFLSFDISGIPAGATIKSATLNLSGTKLGKPFFGLGSLRVYNDQYGIMDASDFTSGFPSGYMKNYSAPLAALFSNAALASKVQARVNAGDSRFQVRLQFQKHTNYNNKVDAWMVTTPTLTIIYEE